MKESILVTSLITAVAILAISAPAAASLGTDNRQNNNTIPVSYADLNLKNEAGARVLYSRLRRASRQACGVESYKNAGSISIKADMQRCYRNTLTASVRKIDRDELTKLHES